MRRCGHGPETLLYDSSDYRCEDRPDPPQESEDGKERHDRAANIGTSGTMVLRRRTCQDGQVQLVKEPPDPNGRYKHPEPSECRQLRGKYGAVLQPGSEYQRH